VQLIRKEPYLEFALKHPTLKAAIVVFLEQVKHADWKTPQDVIETFGVERTDTFTYERVCINIGGGKCRAIIKVRYGYGKAYHRWIGLHKDCNNLTDILLI
jgi:mRNA interferase HigB